ncbi:serine/arginine-rich splicing factor SC35-like [Magnolia sinica]|uniref:serine/arginine-rich splicing factor SC35-like n=1 Tax=Magnolia sinica TaxID=86752 RepID=UPI0026593DBF|nr:serine/arginine-rich splicing factor SC35-like [Magnolia sinica]
MEAVDEHGKWQMVTNKKNGSPEFGRRGKVPLSEYQTLFVQSFLEGWSPENFERVFGSVGVVMEVVVLKDRISNFPGGFAFARMSIMEEMNQAVYQLNGESFGGIKLRVQCAKYGPKRKNSERKVYLQSGAPKSKENATVGNGQNGV